MNKFLLSIALSAILVTPTLSFADEGIPDPFAQFKNNNQTAQPTANNAAPIASVKIPVVIPPAPTFDAESWVLMDYSSGTVLFSHEANKKIWPASLTKMMTSYVIGMEMKAGRLKPTDKVKITEEAYGKQYSDSSKMFIEIGDEVSVDALNKGIIIQSGNDACTAMAIHLAGSTSNFVNVMNTYAKMLGLDNTNFDNVHGLFSDLNYSTALDMTNLGRALIRDLPEEYAIYSQKEFTFNNIKQLNRNRLLWDKNLNVDGIKTGHLSAVGYNLVASATNGPRRLIATVIGAKSEAQRADIARQMLNYGFKYFENYSPFEKDKTILSRDVIYGSTDSINLVLTENVSIMIPRGSQNDIKVTYKLTHSRFEAPIKKGDKLGILELKLHDRVLASYPLVAANDIEEGSFISVMWDKVKLFFSSED